MRNPVILSTPDKSSEEVLGIDRLLSLEDAAGMCSVSIWTIRKWVNKGKIKSIKLGSRRLIPKSELQRLTSEGLLI